MDFTLKRYAWTEKGIFGDMTSMSGRSFSTLEHAFIQVDGFTWGAAVPEGIYVCQRRMSPKFGFDVFELINVPGHSYIEIHKGNVNADSDGCILLGEAHVGDSILNSRIAFDIFMSLQDGIDTFTLVVEGTGF